MNDFWQFPNLGLTREFSSKLSQSLDAWLNLQQASFEYQLVLFEVWLKTVEEFLQVLIFLVQNCEQIQHWQQLLQAWSQLFDRTFAQKFQSEQGIQAKGKFLKAALVFRRQQQHLMEVVLKWNDLPTRSEIDEIHRSIYLLRQELKSLKKTLTERDRVSEEIK